MDVPEYSFPQVCSELGLTLTEADLFTSNPPLTLPAGVAERLQDGVDLALAINTEKARSEFIIAPVFLELRRALGGGFGLFSGVELNVDAARGLSGYCDFLLTRPTLQSVVSAPIVTVVEAKNDNLRTGLGQCIAAMVAAVAFNTQTDVKQLGMYGVVTTGTSWKFLRLVDSVLTLDRREYLISDPARIMGVFAQIVHADSSTKPAVDSQKC